MSDARVIPARHPSNWDQSLDDVNTLADGAIVVRCYPDGTPLPMVRPVLIGIDTVGEAEWNPRALFLVLHDPQKG